MKKYVTMLEKEVLRKKREVARGKKRRELIEKWKQEENPKKKKELARKISKSRPNKSASVWTVSGGLPGLGRRR